MIRPPNLKPHPMPYPAHRRIRPMIRPPNDWPDRHCASCSSFRPTGHPMPCTKHPGLDTHADAGACFDYTPAPRPFRQLCADCARFTLHGTRLLCGAYPGADAPPNLSTCPNFTPRSSSPQPSGD